MDLQGLGYRVDFGSTVQDSGSRVEPLDLQGLRCRV